MSGEDRMCFFNYMFVFHLFDCFLFCFVVTCLENKSNKYILLQTDALFHVYSGKMGNFLNKLQISHYKETKFELIERTLSSFYSAAVVMFEWFGAVLDVSSVKCCM